MDQIALALVLLLADMGSPVPGLPDELLIILVRHEAAVDPVGPERHPLSRQLGVEPSVPPRGVATDPIGIGPLLGIAPHPERAGRHYDQMLVAPASGGQGEIKTRRQRQSHRAFEELTSGHASHCCLPSPGAGPINFA
jgi:hypothetical protein